MTRLTVAAMDEQHKCSRCDEPAVCVYGIHADETWACRAHDPMAQPGWATITLPFGFRYRTLDAYALPPQPGATTQTLAPMLRHHLAPGAVITTDGG